MTHTICTILLLLCCLHQGILANEVTQVESRRFKPLEVEHIQFKKDQQMYREKELFRKHSHIKRLIQYLEAHPKDSEHKGAFTRMTRKLRNTWHTVGGRVAKFIHYRTAPHQADKHATLDILTGKDNTTLFIMGSKNRTAWKVKWQRPYPKRFRSSVYARTQETQGHTKLSLTRADPRTGLRTVDCWNLDWNRNFNKTLFDDLDGWVKELSDIPPPFNSSISSIARRERKYYTEKDEHRAAKLLYFYQTELLIQDWLQFGSKSPFTEWELPEHLRSLDGADDNNLMRTFRNFGLREGQDIVISKDLFTFQQYPGVRLPHQGLGIGHLNIHASSMDFWHILIGIKYYNATENLPIIPDTQAFAQIKNLRHSHIFQHQKTQIVIPYSEENIARIWTIIVMTIDSVLNVENSEETKMDAGGWCFRITEQIFDNIHNFMSFVSQDDIEISDASWKGVPEIIIHVFRALLRLY